MENYTPEQYSEVRALAQFLEYSTEDEEVLRNPLGCPEGPSRTPFSVITEGTQSGERNCLSSVSTGFGAVHVRHEQSRINEDTTEHA